MRNAHANSFPYLFTLTAPESALPFSVNASRPKSDEAQVFTGQNTSRHKRSNYNIVTRIDHACRIAYRRSHIGYCFRFGTRTKRNSLVPTVMHLLAIILGVVGVKATVAATESST